MVEQVYIKRKENKMRQVDVAKKLMMCTKSYGLKEMGKREFTVTEARRLSVIFNCTLDELFGKEETS